MTLNRKHHLGELQHAIMRVLWRSGEATASAVRSALPVEQRRAPTTIATMLTKMEKKGIVAHRAEGRQFVYEPTITRSDVRRTMVSDLTRQLFEGDVTALVAHLLSEEQLGGEDLDALRRLIEERRDEPGSPRSASTDAGPTSDESGCA